MSTMRLGPSNSRATWNTRISKKPKRQPLQRHLRKQLTLRKHAPSLRESNVKSIHVLPNVEIRSTWTFATSNGTQFAFRRTVGVLSSDRQLGFVEQTACCRSLIPRMAQKSRS